MTRLQVTTNVERCEAAVVKALNQSLYSDGSPKNPERMQALVSIDIARSLASIADTLDNWRFGH